MTCNRVVAYGKLTSLDKHSLWNGGQLLGDYCEVLIDTVLEKNLLLPRPVGRIKKQAKLSTSPLLGHLQMYVNDNSQLTNLPNAFPDICHLLTCRLSPMMAVLALSMWILFLR